MTVYLKKGIRQRTIADAIKNFIDNRYCKRFSVANLEHKIKINDDEVSRPQLSCGIKYLHETGYIRRISNSHWEVVNTKGDVRDV